ncbi:hypothetical protein JYU34_004081 [Plutella xylostella]|uniref:TIR domain-containing protein n=1 Tax=Plutella xylostella TaxID=51655 RepID=A0ABQ7QX39_PLUXY|nr:hypothetical protein JYU34_004081 [Plutella xylostella]
MGCVRVCTFLSLALILVAVDGSNCPLDGDCVCGGTHAVELQCNVQGQKVKISYMPNTYLFIRCENSSSIEYDKFPKLRANGINTFQSVTFKDCPLPVSSFRNVLTNVGVSKTLSLIFQNAKNLSSELDRKHFAGLQDLTKLLLSVNGVTNLPDNLFTDMHNLTWLNIRSNGVNLTEQLFKPLEKLETLEISHNHMTNISANLFSHLSFLRKLSLWQSNVTRFSKDLFTGVDVLEELDLSSNGLNELPPSIFNPLTKLKKLTLFSNKFSALPPNLFGNNERLDTVIIFNNDVKLQRLPRGLFSKLPNLKEVYVQRCELESIPHDVFADSAGITNISLAYNEIEILPEAIFNDQINLLELDLSHNKIRELEPKLFSSLVKLESLKLCHNFLQEISGSTFSSLLSLIYLDVEENRLKTITSYLFSNNKQRMSINMAHNSLSFDGGEAGNDSWVARGVSPFARTYNLRMLNLSYNEFRITFDDWWLNGHENLDISHNHISHLWVSNHSLFDRLNQSYRSNHSLLYRLKIKSKEKDHRQRCLKQLWMDNNPLVCDCRASIFLNELREMDTKGADSNLLNCKFMQTFYCDGHELTYFLVLPMLIALTLLGIIYLELKERWQAKLDFSGKYRQIELTVSYSEKDEAFVLKELLPGLRERINVNCNLRPLKPTRRNKTIVEHIKNYIKKETVSIVVFSPNYLTECYCDIEIRKIRRIMRKQRNNIDVFLDVIDDNSLYEYLKSVANPMSSAFWSDSNFWDHLLPLIEEKQSLMKYAGVFPPRKTQKSKSKRSRIMKYTSRPAPVAVTHSQV